jgi:hypothetical protein
MDSKVMAKKNIFFYKTEPFFVLDKILLDIPQNWQKK